MRYRNWLIEIVAALALVLGTNASARTVERDTNGDGAVDRIGHFDSSGRLTLLEVDGDGDGGFEVRQEYAGNMLVLAKRDMDGNGIFDCLNHYTDGKITRQERFDGNGRLTQLAEFDAKGNLLRVRRDTLGDGCLDTTQRYDKGVIAEVLVDADKNDVYESRQEYRNGVLFRKIVDADQDSRAESLYLADEQGELVRSEHDMDGDGRHEVLRRYKDGCIVRQEKRDGLDRVAELTTYARSLPLRCEKDTTSDGYRDLATLFKDGRPVRQEQDTSATGRADTVRLLDAQGNPHEIHRDADENGKTDAVFRLKGGKTVFSSHDEDLDGRMETVCRYENGIRKKLERDGNGDGRAEHREFYAEDGSCVRMESDRSGDGRTDTWQDFVNGQVVRMDADESGNGQVDVRAWFRDGKKKRLERDANEDGRFEITQRYGSDGRGMVLSQDIDGDGKPEAVLNYREGLLREKKLFLPGGEPECVEYFDEHGQLKKSLERESKGLTLTWFYDEHGEALRAERDQNLNGMPEEVFFYQNGSISRVEEDTNADGKPDLWEEYDTHGDLTATAQDMDFDGKPDLVKGRRR